MRTAVLFLSMLLIACQKDPSPTGPPQEVPITTPTGGTTTQTTKVNTTEFCSVKILWNYTDQEITFNNKNDRTSRVTVSREVDNTVMVQNYLLAKGEDSEDASFAIGDMVNVLVEFLELNLSLDQWKKCGEETYILGK